MQATNAEIQLGFAREIGDQVDMILEAAEPAVFYGSPSESWEAIQAAQDSPFVYIQSNGSRWAGQQPGDIAELLDVLGREPLDVERFDDGFWTDNPCYGERQRTEEGTKWVDGARVYRGEVTAFLGNFLNVSHVFSIHTNHAPTIAVLKAAITANVARS